MDSLNRLRQRNTRLKAYTYLEAGFGDERRFKTSVAIDRPALLGRNLFHDERVTTPFTASPLPRRMDWHKLWAIRLLGEMINMLPIRFLMAGVVGLCLNLSLSAPSFAAEPTSCEKLKLTPDKCRDPEVSKWGNWQSFILDQAGARYPNEAGALGEALTTISQQFPCGLNHHIVEVDFVTLDQTWSWVTREGATRIRFVAIPSAPSGACSRPSMSGFCSACSKPR